MIEPAARWSRTIAAPDGTVELSGRVAPGFEPVAEAFCANYASGTEGGAAVHALWRGQEVVSLWGGPIRPAEGDSPAVWNEDSLCVIFSATKPATALCLHLLAHRGLVALDAPVADYWPDFAAEGKGAITLRMVLDHTAGLPALSAPLKPDCLCDHAYMAEQLAAAAPAFGPGTRTAYHPVMGGFILAEVIRRTDGRSLGAFFAEEIADPLGLDFWIGLPEAQEPRVARIEHFVPQKGAAPTPFGRALRDPQSVQHQFFFNHGDWMAKGVNTRAGRAAEIGAASGVSNARGLAGMYEALRPDGPLGLAADQIAAFGQASSATHCDGMLLQPTRFGPGFMLRMDNRGNDAAPPRGDSFLIGRQAFGHVGAGGSFGFRDPEADLSMAYTMTRMGPGFLLNPRGQGLIDATYASMAAAPGNAPGTAAG